MSKKSEKKAPGKLLTHNHLAEGEVTGHYHAAEGAAVYELEDGTCYFDGSEKSVTVTHQEHKAITLPQKEFRSGRVREMDHFEQEARQVRD